MIHKVWKFKTSALLLVVSLCSCATGAKVTDSAQYLQDDSVDASVMLEIRNVSQLDERYRGCLQSSDYVASKALHAWRRFRGNDKQSSLLLINLGGDYISGNYVIVMSHNDKPYVYFSDDAERFSISVSVYENLMRLASTSSPKPLQFDKDKAIQFQHVGCSLAVYLNGPELKIFRSVSDNAGIDSDEIGQFGDPIFSLINELDN